MVENYHNGFVETHLPLITVTIRHKMKSGTDPTTVMDDEVRSLINDTQRTLYRMDDHILPKGSCEGLIVPLIKESMIGLSEHLDVGLTDDQMDEAISLMQNGLREYPWSISLMNIIHAKITGIDDIRLTIDKEYIEERVFIACPPENIKNEMRALMDWTMQSPYDTLVKAAIFLHEYLSIRPYIDDGGLTGLVLTSILLQRNGMKEITSCAFTKMMTKDISRFNTLFLDTERTGNYTEWVREFMISTHGSAIESGRFIETNDILSDENDPRIRILAHTARDHGQFTLQEAVSWVDLGEQTVRSKLERLVELNILEKHGKTKGLRYVYIGD